MTLLDFFTAETAPLADTLTFDQLASAEENALDTLAENGIDPLSLVGRIAFFRLVTCTAELL